MPLRGCSDAPDEAMPGAVLEVGVANGPPCAKMNARDAVATLGGQTLGEVRAAGQDGDSFSRSGPRCVGPRFNGAPPRPGTLSITVSSARARRPTWCGRPRAIASAIAHRRA